MNSLLEKTIVLVGIYNQQFQGTIFLMVFDFQGLCFAFFIFRIQKHSSSSKERRVRSVPLGSGSCGLEKNLAVGTRGQLIGWGYTLVALKTKKPHNISKYQMFFSLNLYPTQITKKNMQTIYFNCFNMCMFVFPKKMNVFFSVPLVSAASKQSCLNLHGGID